MIAGRALAWSGISLFILGVLFMRLLADTGVDSGTLFYVWMALQTTSYTLSIAGFALLLSKHKKQQSLTENTNKQIKPVLRTAAFYSIIFGLVLTFPLLQLALPFFIADISVFVGLILMLLSLLIWILTLFFPRDAKPNSKKSKNQSIVHE